MPMLRANFRSVDEWSLGRPAASPTKKEVDRSVSLVQTMKGSVRKNRTYVNIVLSEYSLKFVPHPRHRLAVAILFCGGEQAKGDIRELPK